MQLTISYVPNMAMLDKQTIEVIMSEQPNPAQPDGTRSAPAVIALAYRAQQFTPSQESFRRNERKKTYNPIHTAPVLNRVVTHMAGDPTRDEQWMKRQARRVVLDPEAGAYINQLQSEEELRQFLATLSLFLKTTAVRGRAGMNTFNAEKAQDHPLSVAEVVTLAYKIQTEISWRKQYNVNKLTKLAGRIRAARDKWECLAVLAQYYPLSGVPQPLINRFVDELGRLNVASFQALVNQVLVFYKAQA